MINSSSGNTQTVTETNAPISWPATSWTRRPQTAGLADPETQLISLTPSITQPVVMPGWKRVIDVAFCLAALPVFALIALIMAVVLKITSPGPILFRQERIGYRNRRFMCYKFRTMVAGADGQSHQKHCENLIDSNAPMGKLDVTRDSRIIPGGWLLRASGMDELPQIINVFQGDMSLVGPRPCVPYEYEKFLPWQRERFNAIPGLTGLWQVSGKNKTTYEQMLRLDVHYAKNIAWWLDLKIIFLTVPTLVGQIVNTRRARKIITENAPAPEYPAEMMAPVENTQLTSPDEGVAA